MRVSTRWTADLSLHPEFGCNVTKFVPDNGLLVNCLGVSCLLKETGCLPCGKVTGPQGPGSYLANTEASREILADVIRDFNITSIFDAGCGDVNWQRFVRSESFNWQRFVSSETVQKLTELSGVSTGMVTSPGSVCTRGICGQPCWLHRRGLWKNRFD